MRNTPEITTIAIDVACCVAMAQFDELEAQSCRLAYMVQHKEIGKQDAVDILYRAAIAADLLRVYGDDFIYGAIAAGFEEVSAC